MAPESPESYQIAESIVFRINDEGDVEIRDDFLYRHYPIDQQRRFSDYLMDVLKIDKDRCTIAETEHPFTSGFHNHDVRLTNHYYENKR